MRKPIPVTPLDMAFGGKCMDILPPYAEIPDEFKRSSNPWCRIASQWFFSGLKDAKFHAREGVDQQQALSNLQCVLGSFEPKHEHKEAGAAYLLSLWFDRVELPEQKGVSK